ncbi:hypothetical protein [Elizabethkingia phage TCUEAP1]|nr:hypothetical protein [Elizabethkingia phage TCUEAP1]
MIINDLSKDNYFAHNDIWIKIGELEASVTYVTIRISNITDPNNVLTMTDLYLYPSPAKEVSLNIAYPVRKLFHPIDHTLEIPNTRQMFRIEVISNLSDGGKLTTAVDKYFIYGGVQKTGLNDWYMKAGESFLVGKVPMYNGLSMPVLPTRIDADNRVETYYPFQDIIQMRLRSCNTYIVKFLNSKGGFQYYIFESMTTSTKSKAGKLLTKRTYSLKEDNFGQENTTTTTTIEFGIGVNNDNMSALKELINSEMVYLFNFSTDPDPQRRWTRLVVDSNSIKHTSYSPMTENKISFILPDFVNL